MSERARFSVLAVAVSALAIVWPFLAAQLLTQRLGHLGQPAVGFWLLEAALLEVGLILSGMLSWSIWIEYGRDDA